MNKKRKEEEKKEDNKKMNQQHIKKLDKIGEGTYGQVYKALDKETNQYLALKEIEFKNQEEGITSTTIREIALLKQLATHPNIVKLYDVVMAQSTLTMVFEFCDQDLKQYIDSRAKQQKNPNNKGLPLDTCRKFCYDLLKGIAFCHENFVLHRDLKPQNLLINNKDGTLKIADFGLARQFGIHVRCMTPEVVTLWYRGPDILMGNKHYTGSVDIWSVGCIFAEMITGRPLFAGTSNEDQLKIIFKLLGTPSSDKWPELKTYSNYQPKTYEKHKKMKLNKCFPQLSKDKDALELIALFLEYRPEIRINAKQAMKHKFFGAQNNNNNNKK